MSETIEVAMPRQKKNMKVVTVKGMVLLIAVGLIYLGLFTVTGLFLKPYVSEDVYSYISSYLFVALGGVFYGLTLVFFQSDSTAHFMTRTRKVIGPLLLTMGIAHFFILLGYVLVFIPGVVLSLLFFLYPFVVVEKEEKNFHALKRSCQLFTRVWFRLSIAVIGFYILFLFVASFILMAFPGASIAAEVIGGVIVFPVEAYVFYRLYKRATIRETIKKGGLKSD